MTAAFAQQMPTTGCTPVDGLKMIYQVHGPDKAGLGNNGEPAAKTREVIDLETRGRAQNSSDLERRGDAARIRKADWEKIRAILISAERKRLRNIVDPNDGIVMHACLG